MRGLRRIVFAALILTSMTATSFMCHRVAQRGRFLQDYSSYGSGPSGLRGLFLLAERLGARPERWSQDLAQLPEGAVLIAAGDREAALARPLSRYEREELVRWVRAGGVLLVAGAPDYVPDELGVRIEADATVAEALEEAIEDDAQDETEGEAQGEVGEESAEPSDWSEGSAAEALEGEAEDDSEAEATLMLEPDETVSIDDLADAPDDELVWAAVHGELLRGIDGIGMHRPGRVVVDDDLEYELLLSMPDAPTMPTSNIRRELGVAARVGAGRVVLLGSGSMWQNDALAASEGGVLFARLLHAYAPGARVLFDEYHLGLGERRSMTGYLREAGAVPIFLQLLGACLLFLWRSGARFGGVREPPAPLPRGTASFVGAMGELYARTRDPKGALEILGRRALRSVAIHHHLRPADARVLARELRARGRQEGALAVEEIARLASAPAVERAALSAAVQQLDAATRRACA